MQFNCCRIGTQRSRCNLVAPVLLRLIRKKNTHGRLCKELAVDTGCVLEGTCGVTCAATAISGTMTTDGIDIQAKKNIAQCFRQQSAMASYHMPPSQARLTRQLPDNCRQIYTHQVLHAPNQSSIRQDPAVTVTPLPKPSSQNHSRSCIHNGTKTPVLTAHHTCCCSTSADPLLQPAGCTTVHHTYS
jgi:hypothetical protein